MPGKREAPPDYGRSGQKRPASRRPQQDAFFEQPRRKMRDEEYDMDATSRYDGRSSSADRRRQESDPDA